MQSPNKIVLSRRAVDALPVAERETVFWDRDLSGFGVRVHPTGSKVYMVHTRAQGKSRRVTIGRHGVWTPERGAPRGGETDCQPQGRRDATPAGCGIALGQRADDRRDGRALSDRARRRALQADDPARMPPYPGQVPASRVRSHAPERGHARPRCGAALPDERQAGHGEPGGLAALPAVLHGREIGRGAGRGQSLPVHPEISDARARALSVGAGVRPPGPGARRARNRGHALDQRGRGAAPADADRLPAQRNRHASMGARRP